MKGDAYHVRCIWSGADRYALAKVTRCPRLFHGLSAESSQAVQLSACTFVTQLLCAREIRFNLTEFVRHLLGPGSAGGFRLSLARG